VLGTLADLTRGKAERLAENALLRHQLIILRRQVKRLAYRKTDRLLLVVLARMVRTWKQALFLVQPETLLRLPSWALPRVLEAHTQGALEQAEALFRDDQFDEAEGGNQSPSSERIRGELLTLDIRVRKRSIQKDMWQVPPKRARGQSWKTFLRNHAARVRARDFLQVTDLFFRPLCAFFLIEWPSRKVVHVNVARSPTDLWVAHQLREATAYRPTPQ
jgi:putative transposase